MFEFYLGEVHYFIAWQLRYLFSWIKHDSHKNNFEHIFRTSLIRTIDDAAIE